MTTRTLNLELSQLYDCTRGNRRYRGRLCHLKPPEVLQALRNAVSLNLACSN
jgi:hypothetical protein